MTNEEIAKRSTEFFSVESALVEVGWDRSVSAAAFVRSLQDRMALLDHHRSHFSKVLNETCENLGCSENTVKERVRELQFLFSRLSSNILGNPARDRFASAIEDTEAIIKEFERLNKMISLMRKEIEYYKEQIEEKKKPVANRFCESLRFAADFLDMWLGGR